MEGFDLLSKESVALQNKQSSTSMEGDAWIISLHEAENLLLVGGARKKVLSILKTIRDRHLDLQVNIKMTKMRLMMLYDSTELLTFSSPGQPCVDVCPANPGALRV